MSVSIDDVRCIHATDDAILVDVDGDEYWIPNSQVTDDSEVWRKGDEGELVITEWWSTKEGLR